MDKIRIENLEIFAKHGVFPEENFLGQKFVLSAVLHTDTRKAGLTDELSYSVHYGEVSHLIKKVVEENTWKLLETVAEATAKAILLSYPMVSQVDLTIKKTVGAHRSASGYRIGGDQPRLAYRLYRARLQYGGQGKIPERGG